MFNKKSPTKVGIFFKPQTLSSLSNKKIMLIFPVILLILSVFVAGGWLDPIGLPPDDEEPPPLYDSTLQITEITAKVDGKKDTITNNGEKISKEAKEESDVEFEISLKNIWDKKIEDIDITVTMEDIDDGDDLDEDADIDELDPGDSEKVDVNFDLPLKVDDDNYDVRIHVEGKDEDNNLHVIDWTLILEVEKEKNNVKITKALLYPSAIQCSRITSLQIELLNLGREEEDVKLEIKNEDLGINIQEKDIELDTGTDDDAEYEKTYGLEIPDNLESGTYPITINAYYNKEKSVITKKVNLIIEDCKQAKETISVKSLPPTLEETIGTAKQKEQKETSIIFTYEEPIVLFSVILLIILTGLIIFLVGAIVINLRK